MKKRIILSAFLIVSAIFSTDTTVYNGYTEETEVSIVEVDVKETAYYDVPLSHDIQDTIFEECEKHNIAPALIIAMINQESSFDAGAIGDSGRSKGLMQIQQRYHGELMEQLGCNDLLDPHQNVKVGINIVSNLRETNQELYWVLMAYNGGPSYATKHFNNNNISDYAINVTEYASMIQDEYDAQFN